MSESTIFIWFQHVVPEPQVRRRLGEILCLAEGVTGLPGRAHPAPGRRDPVALASSRWLVFFAKSHG